MVVWRRKPEKQQRPKLDHLLSDLERGRSPNHVGRAAAAHFECDPLNLDELRFDLSGNDGGKILFGMVGADPVEGQRLPDGRRDRWLTGGLPVGLGDDRHACLIAGSRAGKGRSVLVPNLLTYPGRGSILTVDPKGDHARLTARYRATVLGQRVCVLDPYGVSGKGTLPYRVAFNALASLQRCPPEAIYAAASMIADALVVPGSERDSHWNDCARQFLTALVAHVLTSSLFPDDCRDLVTVWELVSILQEPDPTDDSRFRLEVEMQANPACDGAIQAATSAFYGRSGGEFSSVASTVRKVLNWVSSPAVRSCLRGPSIDLTDLKRDSVAIYVTVPAMRMAELSGWMRLLVQLALAACEQTEFASRRPPVLFILDEFHVLGRMDAIEKAIAQIAGFGVKLWPVLQDLGQLKAYRNWETFLGNTGFVQAFGNVDLTTLDYLSRQLGSTLVANPSQSSQAFGAAAQHGGKGESWSIGSHPLMTPEEIARTFGRDDPLLRQLVLRPGHRPLVLQRAFYDKHELFTGRTKGRTA